MEPKENDTGTMIPEVAQGPPSDKERVKREEVNCCYVCNHFSVSDDAEHEDGGGLPYCLWDGSDTDVSLICEHFEKDPDLSLRRYRLRDF